MRRSNFTSMSKGKPEAAKLWDYEDNESSPDDVSMWSKEKYWFICKDGHKFQMEASRIPNDSNYCIYDSPTSSKVYKGYNDFKTKYPEKSKLWAYDLNKNLKGGPNPEDYTSKSNKVVWWRDPEHYDHIWKSSINNMAAHAGKCPVCMNKVVIPGVNDLFTARPDLKDRWSQSNNDDPSTLPTTSAKMETWKCDKGHTFNKKVHEIVYDGSCPECNKNESFGDKRPYLACNWDYKRNKDMPEDVSIHLTASRWFICPVCHSSFSHAINTMKWSECPKCHRHTVQNGQSLRKVYPARAKQWDHNKNGDLTPDKVKFNSSQLYWWICNKCGHSYQSDIANNKACPYCKQMRYKKSRLASIRPDLEVYWDSNKNDVDFNTISIYDDTSYWWICNRGTNGCEHSWQISPASIAVANKNICPYCDNRKALAGYNDLATVNPTAAAMWDYSKNGELRPDNVCYGSTIEVWWICEHGHLDYRSVRYKCKYPSCPICLRSRRIRRIPDNESLADRYPRLAAEWDSSKNLDSDGSPLSPDEVKTTDCFMADWKCKHGHEWKASVANRTKYGYRCPVCFEGIDSRKRNNLISYVKTLLGNGYEYEENDIDDEQVDLIVPDIELGLRFAYSKFYSTKYRKADDSSLELKAAEDSGYDLHVIWEDQWDKNKKSIRNLIRQVLLPESMVHVDLNECSIRKSSIDEMMPFIRQNSIYIPSKSDEIIALYKGGRPLSVLVYTIDSNECRIKFYVQKRGRNIMDAGVMVDGGLRHLLDEIAGEHDITSAKVIVENCSFDKDYFINEGFKIVGNLPTSYDYVEPGGPAEKMGDKNLPISDFFDYGKSILCVDLNADGQNKD